MKGKGMVIYMEEYLMQDAGVETVSDSNLAFQPNKEKEPLRVPKVPEEKSPEELSSALGVSFGTASENTAEFSPVYPNLHFGYLFWKRAFDIVLSFAASIVLLIPIAVLAVIIVFKDPGNPFYFHQRVGKNGRSIYILKLRTMRKGADDIEKVLTPEQLIEYKREYKLEDDPRLIGYKNAGDGKRCFGARLRQMSLDELPQIPWNILIKGNLSFVGARPILQTELEKNYTPEQQKLLLSAKPGLTGYWQAYARNDAMYEDGKRQQMELQYVRTASALFDLKIILKTVEAVVRKSGAK